MSNRCYKHSVTYPDHRECPECLAEEREEERERQEERHEEMLEQEEERRRIEQERHEELLERKSSEIYERANPGDYECPECLYVTLKRSSSRCRACHAVIPNSYWQKVYEAEAARVAEAERRRQQAAEEWAKGEPERIRQAQAEQLRQEELQRKAQAEQLAARRRKFWSKFLGWYYLYWLPIITISSLEIVVALFYPVKVQWVAVALFFIPLLNWIFVVGFLFVSDEASRTALIVALGIWIVLGPVIGTFLRPSN